MYLFQPPKFLTMRTIRKHRLHIAANRFLDQSMGSIKYPVG